MLNNNRLNTYLNVTSAYQPTVVPNNEKLSFITKKSGTQQAWLWEENNEKQITFFNDRIMGVYFSPDGKKAVVSTDNHGNEKEQFYIMNKDGSKVEELVISPEHFHFFGGWSPDGNKITYSSNRRHPGYFDVYALNILSKEEHLIFKCNGNCKPLFWLRNGKQILVSIAETNIDNTLYILDIASEKMAQVGGGKRSARYQSPVLMNSDKSGFVLSDKDDNTMGLYKFPVEQPEQMVQVIKPGKWDIEAISLSKDDQNLVYTINEGGKSRIYIYNKAKQESKLVTGHPDGVVESIQWMNEGQFIFSLKSPIYPGDIWRYSISFESVERLTHFGSNQEIEKEWIEPTLCSYHSFDGLEVPYFYYEKGGENKPAIVYVHGGPESQIRFEFNPVIQYLVNEGFNVAVPNVRGSMGYGRQYVQLDDGRKRMDAVADLSFLAEELVKTKSVNQDHIGIMGRSYGGFMVLAALTHYPNIWSAGVDIVGISHFRTFLENTGPWRRKMREYEYGSLSQDIDFFEEIAPLNHTNHITAPLLIFHGRNDTRVPVTEAEQLYSDMKEQGQEVELIIFEDEGHQTERLENHITMNQETVSFMRRHLQGNCEEGE